MQLNVWNDLAKAKRRWTEKTGRFLAAVQPSPWLRPAASKPLKQKPIDGTRQDSPKNQTNESNETTFQQNSVRGGNRWRYLLLALVTLVCVRWGCEHPASVTLVGRTHISPKNKSGRRSNAIQAKEEKNRRIARTNNGTIHHEGRRRREEKSARIERNKKGESSTDWGGRRMQL